MNSARTSLMVISAEYFSCASLHTVVTVLICYSGIIDLNTVWLLKHLMVPVMLKRGHFLDLANAGQSCDVKISTCLVRLTQAREVKH